MQDGVGAAGPRFEKKQGKRPEWCQIRPGKPDLQGEGQRGLLVIPSGDRRGCR
jgi:hypothetical protein